MTEIDLRKLQAVPEEHKKPSYAPTFKKQLREAEKLRDAARKESEKAAKELKDFKAKLK